MWNDSRWEEERDAKQRRGWSGDGDVEKPGIGRREKKRDIERKRNNYKRGWK